MFDGNLILFSGMNFYFPSKKNFDRKIFNSVVFPFPDFAHDAQTSHNAELNS